MLVESTTPKSNRAFWTLKFARNIARDRASVKALRELGFAVAIIWECESEDRAIVRHKLANLVAHKRN